MVCITMDSHGRDIVQKLIREKVSDATEFQWQSQLKHKYRETPSTAGMMCFPTRDPHLRDPPGNPETGLGGKRAEIAICDAIMPYDYEYLGNGPRLVITPLTDRIYVTATQSLTLMMGCAPAGTISASSYAIDATRLARPSEGASLTSHSYQTQVPPGRARPKARKISARPWRRSSTSSTAPPRWTTRVWATSSRASGVRARGAASTSSTD